MYVESDGDCFDPSVGVGEGGGVVVLGAEDDGFPQNPSFPLEEEEEGHPYHHHHHNSSEAAAMEMEMELQQQLNLEMEQCYNDNNGNNGHHHHQGDPHFMQKLGHENQGLSNWEELGFSHQPQSFQIPMPETPCPPAPDLLNMFPLPRCSPSSLLPNPSFSSTFLTSLGLFGDLPSSAADGASPSTVVCDPSLLPLNLPPQPPLLRELFHSLPQGGYGFGASRSSGSLFGEVDEREVNGAFYQTVDGCRDFENGVFELTGDMNVLAKNRDGKGTKHFATERQRRVHLNDKYEALKKLVPNPSKNDRASVVHDAIGYINELKRTVGELKILVEKKRCSRERMKRHKTEGCSSMMDGGDLKSVEDVDQSYSGTTLRSSWLQRKSKNTEVDVRIIDDEVTVKLVQQKRINCLLFVSKALDELQLDLHHVAGGLIGDYYSFLFNSKICEGSTVYASAIANKLIEVVDKHYTAIAPTTSY
ncbi:PREDICTED: transcription factor bHLH91-like [Ipomoea nil]|uniref:transcription factor bHLH91-like n=1 Tax=Ipomoea nil TaxID=35883 RepID=UPI000900988A|nr:PREDICTED: transcription factor bHLH91-like [Ipomoea nil]XP_019192641.1 PREDICTED: transcription factor bHLH91-like [Ipomoea nil]XP_019192647.1 PREDICTED: transcription factor bHLH91-like [Ipomoea nil]